MEGFKEKPILLHSRWVFMPTRRPWGLSQFMLMHWRITRKFILDNIWKNKNLASLTGERNQHTVRQNKWVSLETFSFLIFKVDRIFCMPCLKITLFFFKYYYYFLNQGQWNTRSLLFPTCIICLAMFLVNCPIGGVVTWLENQFELNRSEWRTSTQNIRIRRYA